MYMRVCTCLHPLMYLRESPLCARLWKLTLFRPILHLLRIQSRLRTSLLGRAGLVCRAEFAICIDPNECMYVRMYMYVYMDMYVYTYIYI